MYMNFKEKKYGKNWKKYLKLSLESAAVFYPKSQSLIPYYSGMWLSNVCAEMTKMMGRWADGAAPKQRMKMPTKDKMEKTLKEKNNDTTTTNNKWLPIWLSVRALGLCKGPQHFSNNRRRVLKQCKIRVVENVCMRSTLALSCPIWIYYSLFTPSCEW